MYIYINILSLTFFYGIAKSSDATYYRYVRVNTLKRSLEDVLKQLKYQGYEQIDNLIANFEEGKI